MSEPKFEYNPPGKTSVPQKMQLMQQVRTGSDLEAVRQAASASVAIQAKYVMAMERPRNEGDARAALLKKCEDFKFAVKARYKKPIGGKDIPGFSIRFAEAAKKIYRNLHSDVIIVSETPESRKLSISTIDYENNDGYTRETIINKAVERRTIRNKDGDLVKKVVGDPEGRLNSKGIRVWLVEATEDEILSKEGAICSKIMRNQILELIPQEVLDEAEEVIELTLNKKISQEKPELIRQISDSFTAIGVMPSEIEERYGCKLESLSNEDVMDLRKILTAIKEGNNKWSDYDVIERKKVATGSLSGLKASKSAVDPHRDKAKRGRPARKQDQPPKQSQQEPPKAQTPPPATKEPDPPKAKENEPPTDEKKALHQEITKKCITMGVGTMYVEAYLVESYSRNDFSEFSARELKSILTAHFGEKEIDKFRDDVTEWQLKIADRADEKRNK